MSLLAAAGISAGASLLGGILGRKSAKKTANTDYQNQKEFAQHGIRWKVEDARAAGLHPLAALGATSPQYSPSYQTDPLPDAVASAGQSIGRAIGAKSQEYPTGVITYPDGSAWPHYYDKSGKPVPFSSQQMAMHTQLQGANAQLRVTDAQTDLYRAQTQDLLNPQAPQIPNMFEMYNHPSLGKIPFPNQTLGESAEALANPYIAGQWLKQLATSQPKLYSRIVEDAATGRASVVTELLGAAPDIAKAIMDAVKKSLDQW